MSLPMVLRMNQEQLIVNQGSGQVKDLGSPLVGSTACA